MPAAVPNRSKQMTGLHIETVSFPIQTLWKCGPRGKYFFAKFMINTYPACLNIISDRDIL